ncbi:serine O-acetyltransferase [Pseudarthrobacter chlorophenolicus]|uniref:serine O-acetyltransferase n=1 Tax=Pseudarthrobacter chlorophenolicus TaxID=85085 RepID=UPI0009E47C28
MTSLGDAIRTDYSRIQPGRKYSVLRALDATTTNPGMLATLIYRLQCLLFDRGYRRLAGLARVANNSLTGADILPGSSIGAGLLLPHPNGVVIGHGVRIGSSCTILQGVTIGEKFADGRAPHDYPQIGNGVVIGAGAILLGNLAVGDGASIAANAVVLSDVPANSVVAGSPARIIRTLTSPDFRYEA